MALDRDDADEIRRVTAMRFTAALLSAGRHTATDAVTAGLFAADELLSRLRPVAPLPGAPLAAPSRPEWVPSRDEIAHAVRRGFTAMRDGEAVYPGGLDWAECYKIADEVVEILPAPSPSPAATPAAWVPSVGDVVTWGLCLWLYRVEAVTATSAYVRCCDKRGDIGDCTEVLLETPDLRRATSSERAAAGLPPVDAPAFDEAKEREAAFASLGHNVAGTRDYVDGFVMGWLARARVAAKEPRSGDDRPASGQSATKPVDRGALLDAMRAAFREWRRTPEDTRDTEVVATDAAIAFMAKGCAS